MSALKETAPWAAAALGAALSCVTARAEANGVFPASGQIVVDPGDATHLVVRANFGFLVSRDAGLHFDWICESGAGYGGGYDPGIAVTADGTIVAGLLTGLDVGHGDACTWGFAGGGLAGAVVPDVSTLKSHPASVFALVSGATAYSVWGSQDNAMTWAQAGASLSSDFQGVTLDVAPSDPNRIYVSGTHKVGAAFNGAIARSDDGGATWHILDITSLGALTPYLAGIDPIDANVLYVRPDAMPGSLLMSTDGGATWATIFKLKSSSLSAFALSPDGQTILVGSSSIGVWRASKPSLQFAQASPFGATCLAWAGANVYACSDKVAVGLSTDQGSTFSTLLDLTCIRGPLACDPASPVGSACPGQWPALETKLGITSMCTSSTGASMGSPDAGPSLDGGPGGGATTSTSASAGPSASSGAGAGGAGAGGAGPVPAAGGCGCGSSGADAGAGLTLELIALAALARRRRRGAALRR